MFYFILQQTFQVSGFSVSGRVINSVKGSGVGNAAVYVNSKKQSTTKSDGTYHLENMKTGSYIIKVEADNILFDETSVKISPNTPHLPDIIATKFSLCGQIVIDKLPEGLRQVPPQRRVIYFPEGKNSDAVSIATDKDGKFCTHAASGKYLIKVHLTEEEIAGGLQIIPSEKSIIIPNAPLLDVMFTQFRAKVTGAVACLEKCGSMEVSLEAVGRDDFKQTVQERKFQTGKYDEKIEAQNSLLKIEVDNHTDKLKSEIMKRWEVLHQSTQTVEKEVALRIKSLESQNSEVDDIIKSKHAERVFVDSSELINSMGQNVLSSCTKYTSIPTFLPGHITAFNVGSLENVSTRDEIKIVQTLYTEISDVFHMTACAEDMLWISNSNRLQKVRIEGNSLKIIHEKQMRVYDMVCTQSKDLLLVSVGSVLIQISDQTGEITNSKYEVQDLELTAVHVNSHGKVTVGAFIGKLYNPAIGRRVVIWTSCLKILKGRVVILSEDGDVLNTFSDPPEVKVAFKPKHAFTTPSDRIIISDFTNDLLYVLTSSGNLIKWFDTKLLRIPTPYSLCISNSGHTYIGCVTGTKSSDNAMLYKVNILRIKNNTDQVRKRDSFMLVYNRQCPSY
ncbi:unnamed protein product [Mytilus edulis]|uniref:NOMO fifth transthyretin-like domain-containing protein n=1 Tax=Mytilus edulis TaxID=6550 RepID=A0A8S3QCE9_MYTED|nr:unnamed protein product [Mytilus edulis]